MSTRNRRNRPLIPGQPCPADRNNSSTDPKVTVTAHGAHHRDGYRDCGRCGLPRVKVRQNWGERHSAWYYAPHNVPPRE